MDQPEPKCAAVFLFDLTSLAAVSGLGGTLNQEMLACAIFALQGPLEAIPTHSSSLVDHRFALLRVLLPSGRPSSVPFSRNAAALRFDFASPRQAGQQQTSEILWSGHFTLRHSPNPLAYVKLLPAQFHGAASWSVNFIRTPTIGQSTYR